MAETRNSTSLAGYEWDKRPLSVSRYADELRYWRFSRECLEDLAIVGGTLLERVSVQRVGGKEIRLKIRVLPDLRRDLVQILRKEGYKPAGRKRKKGKSLALVRKVCF